MAGIEENLQPSKKRAPGRQLSRDNTGSDDDASEEEGGTFKKASDEVLASRKIVKVRRNTSAPISNPFSGIHLVPFTQPTSEAETTKIVEEEKPENDTPEAKTEPITDKIEETKVADEKKDDIKAEEKKDDIEKSVEKTPFNSFQQLSSSQNAFTGLVGSGFSSSSFSFGSVSKDGSGSGTGTGSIFGAKTDQPGFSFNGGSLFPASGTSIVNKTEKALFPSMPEVPIETGEENEKAVLTTDSVLFEFNEGGWKERGKGELKVNISTKESGKARLVMRTKGNYRLILNASLYPDMKLTNMDKKGITFACINSASEGKDGLSTYALKFKDGLIVEEFRAVVNEYKGKSCGELKTPENSPKAEDD